MKFWKCPHCKKMEQTADDSEPYLLCPDCPDRDMEEVSEDIWKLHVTKPKDFKGFEDEKLCLRCNKRPQINDTLFCKECNEDRDKIDKNITGMNKFLAERTKKAGREIPKPKENPYF